VCKLVTGFGLRLLIAAVLATLLALPAAAHRGHGQETAVTSSGAVLDNLADQARSVAQLADKQEARSYARASPSCCCRLGANFMASGSGSGMTCGSGASGHISGLALPYGADTAGPAKAMFAYISEYLLAGLAPGPGDRPPRA
jgi:hypothetical protein